MDRSRARADAASMSRRCRACSRYACTVRSPWTVSTSSCARSATAARSRGVHRRRSAADTSAARPRTAAARAPRPGRAASRCRPSRRCSARPAAPRRSSWAARRRRPCRSRRRRRRPGRAGRPGRCAPAWCPAGERPGHRPFAQRGQDPPAEPADQVRGQPGGTAGDQRRDADHHGDRDQGGGGRAGPYPVDQHAQRVHREHRGGRAEQADQAASRSRPASGRAARRAAIARSGGRSPPEGSVRPSPQHRPAVGLVGRAQLGVRALGRDPAVVQHHDPVGGGEQRGAACDQQRGSSPSGLAVPQRPDALRDGLLGHRVHRGGRVVQHQDRRPGQQRPGQREPLPLTPGQAGAALGDQPLEAVRVLRDDLVGGRGGQRRRQRRRVIGSAAPAVTLPATVPLNRSVWCGSTSSAARARGRLSRSSPTPPTSTEPSYSPDGTRPASTLVSASPSADRCATTPTNSPGAPRGPGRRAARSAARRPPDRVGRRRGTVRPSPAAPPRRRARAPTRSADPRASATQLGMTASRPSGSSRNCARPMTVISSPMLIRPSRANQPASTATAQASSADRLVEAAR